MGQTCLGLTCSGQCRFRPTCRRRVGPRRVEASKGGAPERWGPIISRLFFPLPPQFSFFLPSLGGGLLVVFWWCLKRRGPEMCTMGLSGCHVKPRRLQGRRGFTRQPENSKRAHFRAPALQTPPKFNERTPQEREERMKIVAGEGKKSEFWAVRREGSGGSRGPPEGGPAEGSGGGGSKRGSGEGKKERNFGGPGEGVPHRGVLGKGGPAQGGRWPKKQNMSNKLSQRAAPRFFGAKDGLQRVGPKTVSFKKKWSGPKVVWAKSGQTLSGPEVVWAKSARAKSGYCSNSGRNVIAYVRWASWCSPRAVLRFCKNISLSITLENHVGDGVLLAPGVSVWVKRSNH